VYRKKEGVKSEYDFEHDEIWAIITNVIRGSTHRGKEEGIGKKK
jgi:hypothetical protein